MENSETQKRIINLGKFLVDELGESGKADMLCKWMANYIAEQMVVADNTTGKDKKNAEKRCFDTILKLWNNRRSLPDGKRPFENFEPIFRVMEEIGSQKETSFYLRKYFQKSRESENATEPIAKEVETWINIARNIDDAARILIEFVFKQAANVAADEKTASFLKNSPDLTDDVSVILNLTTNAHVSGEDADKEIIERMQEKLKEELKFKIEKLDTFNKIKETLRKALSNELKKLSQKNEF